MSAKLFRTPASPALTVIRVVLGVLMFAHGAQKMLGWFGGYGFSTTMHFFTGSLHLPWIFSFLAICAEFFGGIGLVLGLFGRVAAFGVGVDMVAAAILGGHIHNGFFMNWSGKQGGEGFEYHLLAIAIALAVMIGGSGACSLDRVLCRDGDR